MPETAKALVLAQRACRLDSAEAAVALAEQIFRRRSAVVVVDVKRDRFRHGVGIAADAPEVLGVIGLGGAAPAGADRIDEDEVGEGEPGVGIVVQLGVRRVASAGAEIEDAGAGEAEMQEGGGRAGAAVEHEGQRAIGAAVFPDIGGVEDLGTLFARLVKEGERAGGRRIGEPAVPGIDRMLGDRVGRQQPQDIAAAAVLTLPFSGRRFAALAAVGAVLGGGRADDENKQRRERDTQKRNFRHGTSELQSPRAPGPFFSAC